MNVQHSVMRSLQVLGTLMVCVFVLSGCAENASTVTFDENDQMLLEFRPPSQITTRAIVVDNLNLDVRINDLPLEMVRTGDTWSGSRVVPEGSSVNLEISWSELVEQTILPLAVARETIESITQNEQFSFVDDNYISEGIDFDADSDLISNLTERRQDTDPYDADDPGSVSEVPATVLIPASLRPNIIDGQWDNSFWNTAQQTDLFGADLLVDSLIVDENAAQLDGGRYKWAAQHNGQFLSIFVFGKVNNSGQNLFGDSGDDFYQDDSLEIFFDGDLSGGADYDRIDDMHIVIPLLRGSGAAKVGNKSGEPDTRIKRGDKVQPDVPFDVNSVEFATCLCSGSRVTWEVRIDLADAGIKVGPTFGFEIQINQDEDGGARDAKWAWDYPPRGPNDTNITTDVTWKYPSQMGEVKLLPFPDSR